MLAPILLATLVVVLISSTFVLRRRESRRDSIARFADARKAMSITQGRPSVHLPDVTPHESGNGSEPGQVVVRSGSAMLFDPLARRRISEARRSFRRDPEVLARRPTVALLPTFLGSHCGPGANALAPTDRTDAQSSGVPLSAPASEAS